MRRALVYVLRNGLKHGSTAFAVDPLSSAAWFDGFAGRPPARTDAAPVAPATTWLLATGWRARGGRRDSPRRGAGPAPAAESATLGAMIPPYQAIGLIPTVVGVRRRDEIARNLYYLSHLVKAAMWLTSLDLPVRLIAIPEGALQGFTDEVMDVHHETYARECAIDIPGPETDDLERSPSSGTRS